MDMDTAIMKKCTAYPEHYGSYPVANHIRALLDLIEWGSFAAAQGMNNDFICNPMYDTEVFEKVWSMRELPNWNQIDAFIWKEISDEMDSIQTVRVMTNKRACLQRSISLRTSLFLNQFNAVLISEGVCISRRNQQHILGKIRSGTVGSTPGTNGRKRP